MAGSFSFDIVSEVDFQEVDNAVNQAQKELAQRFDFKNSGSSIEYDRAGKKITLVSENDFKLNALRDILEGRLAKRGVSLKALKSGVVEESLGGKARQVIELISGLPSDRAKELVKLIKGFNLKAQAQIEGEKLRVSSPKKDELQAVIARIRAAEFPLPLQFTNYR